MTRVEKLFSSHFRISQQFFKEDTPGSLVDNADWLLHGQNGQNGQKEMWFKTWIGGP